MFTVVEIEFEQWEEKLPWVKSYKALLSKTPLLAKDCLDFLNTKLNSIEMHLTWARAENYNPDEVSGKFMVAVNNLVGLVCDPISEFEDLVKALEEQSPKRDDKDLFSDELKERFLDASEFRASLMENPLYINRVKRQFRKTPNAREEAEKKFTEQKQICINRYINILNKEKEILQQRSNELTTEEDALNKEYSDTQNLIDELFKQIQKETNELKIEIRRLQPVKQPTVGVAMPQMGPPPPPPTALKPLVIAKATGLQINKPKSQSADTSTTSSTVLVTDDVLANLKLRPTRASETIKPANPEPAESSNELFAQLLRHSSNTMSRGNSVRSPVSMSQPTEIKQIKAIISIEDVETTLSTNAVKILRKEELIVHIKERNATQQEYYKQLLQQKERLRLLKVELNKGVQAANQVKKLLEEEKERKQEEERQRVLAATKPDVLSPVIGRETPPPPPPPPPPPQPLALQVKPQSPELTRQVSFQEDLALAHKKKEKGDLSAKPSIQTKAESAPVTRQDSQAALNFDLTAFLMQRRQSMFDEKPKKAKKKNAEAIAREEAFENTEKLKRQKESEYRESTLEKHRALAKFCFHEPSESLDAFHSSRDKITATKELLEKQRIDASNSQEFDALQTSIQRLIEALNNENTQAALRAKEEIPARDQGLIAQEDKNDKLLGKPIEEVPPLMPVSTIQVNQNQNHVAPVTEKVQPAIDQKNPKTLSPFDKMLHTIERNDNLKILMETDNLDNTVVNILENAVNKTTPNKLAHGTISDLLILSNYAAKKRKEIGSIAFSSEEESERYNTELITFYKQALAERLSNDSPAEQYEKITKAAHAIFTQRDAGLRLFADVLLTLSVLGIAIVGLARKASGYSFFFSNSTTQREDDLKSLCRCRSAEDIQDDESSLFAAPAA